MRDLLLESIILGVLLYLGLSNIEVNVNVYVDSKKATAAEAAATTERPETDSGE